MFRAKIYKSNIYAFFLVPAIGLMLAGCSEDQKADTSPSDDSPRMIERPAPQRQTSRTTSPDNSRNEKDFRVVPKIEGSLEEDGMGLETIIDASNKQAYADSLKWIAEDVSKQQFDRLENSIRYIHMYDSSVLGDESKLLSVIDGKTGNEIIERAKKLQGQLQGQRRGN